jgi:3-hydroxy acid dehydrogenase/malonic semialdehyde reductase
MNRTILITGATSGFGEACARKFAADGDRLILTGRRRDRLESLRGEFKEILPLTFDVRDRAAVDAAIGSIPPEWRLIDILINNAGLALGRDYFDEASLEDWETMIDTNVKGLLYVQKPSSR